MGVEASGSVRMRAQVLCSGTKDLAKKKFLYEGVADCIAATKLGGGDKLCPNGCIGLGTCAAVCPFEAIEIHNGVAVVNYHKCQACGLCADACPKHLIELIPFDSRGTMRASRTFLSSVSSAFMTSFSQKAKILSNIS